MPDATAFLFFDPDRLSEVIGQPVVAGRLRHKPGLSTVAALRGPTGIVGWAQVASREHEAKVAKALRRAGEAGRVRTVEVDGLTCVFGPVESDPALVKGFREVPLAEGDEIVRYNPQRRAVVRTSHDGAPASRRYHGAPGEARATARRTRALQASGIPTISPVARTRYTTTWPWVGETDLAALHGPPRRLAARRAGASLARLHAVAPTVTRRIDPRVALLTGADDLARLDAALGGWARGIVERLPFTERDLVAAHGDFSADQVAVGTDAVWLLDLDRHGLAPRGMDLGSFHAVELLAGVEPVTEDLLRGYAGIGLDEVRPWVVTGLLSRMAEPFREADPEWRGRIEQRLRQMEEWL